VSLAWEIKAAAQTGQADMVLQLCDSGREPGGLDFGEGWIEAAQTVLELALRMRLPYGRNGAWTKHLQLLQLVCTIVESGKAATGEQRADPAVEATLLRARKLLSSGDQSIRKQE